MTVDQIILVAGGAIATKTIDLIFKRLSEKTSQLNAVAKDIGRLEGSDDRIWEKLCMIRLVLEANGIKIQDREWTDGNKSKSS